MAKKPKQHKRATRKRKTGKKAADAKTTAPKPKHTAPEITAADLGLAPPEPEQSKPAPQRAGRTPPAKPEKGPESIDEVLEVLGPLFPEKQREALLKLTEHLLLKYLPRVCYVVPLQITAEQRSIVNHMIQRANDEGKNLFVWDYYEAMVRAGTL